MALPSRPNTFVGGTLAIASEVNANEELLYDLLSGASSSVRSKIVFNGADPVMELDQTGVGSVLQLRQAGNLKLEVNNAGQLDSKVTTGTAPFIVASTTAVTNLNADKVDGKDASAFVELTNDWSITTPAGEFRLLEDGNVRLNVSATRALFLTPPRWEGNPATDDDLTRRSYVLTRERPWSVGVFYEGTSDTTTRAAQWIVPLNVNDLTVSRLTIVRGPGGTSSGTTTIRVDRNGSSIGTVSLTSEGVNGIKHEDITPVTLSAGDRISFTITSSGSQQNISMQISGTHKVSL